MNLPPLSPPPRGVPNPQQVAEYRAKLVALMQHCLLNISSVSLPPTAAPLGRGGPTGETEI